MRNDRPSLTRLDQIDPEPLLRELMARGEADPATVTLLRLQWLRREQPAAQIETAVVPIDDRLVAVQVRIATPAGWSVSAHAAVELPDNPGLALEQAETRALTRALDLAGYALTELPANISEQAAEPPRQEPHPRGARREPVAIDEPATSTPGAPEPMSPDESPAPDAVVRPLNRPAVVDALRKVPGRGEPRPTPVEDQPAPTRPQRGDFTVVHDRRPRPAQPEPAAPAGDEDEDKTPVEDYSWTAFWRWAKACGLSNQAEIADVIGKPVAGMNPGEIRAALREHGIEG